MAEEENKTWIVPDDQGWLRILIEEQTRVLNKINNRLTFIVIVIIIGIVLIVLRGCL